MTRKTRMCDYCSGLGGNNVDVPIDRPGKTSHGQLTQKWVTCSHCHGLGEVTDHIATSISSGRNSNKTGGSSCFVATAVYGTNQCQELDILRQFRDQKLRKSKIGVAFINWYYQYGPHIAAFVKDKPRLKTFIKSCLDRFCAFYVDKD